MLLRWLLFETRAGELLLAPLEKGAGLALVRAEWLVWFWGGIIRDPAAAGRRQRTERYATKVWGLGRTDHYQHPAS